MSVDGFFPCPRAARMLLVAQSLWVGVQIYLCSQRMLSRYGKTRWGIAPLALPRFQNPPLNQKDQAVFTLGDCGYRRISERYSTS